MKSKSVAITALVLAVIGLLATVAVFAFQTAINKLGSGEAAAFGSLAVCLVGCVLGWINFKSPEGKVAAILGTLLVVFYVSLLFVPPDRLEKPRRSRKSRTATQQVIKDRREVSPQRHSELPPSDAENGNERRTPNP